ncbi:MAG: hypothetical protein ACKVI6_06045 [Candidatus Poseidoniales archaeon]|jgi:pimeloyl-ACP methyl ester carboxylesterase|tara:strand:+ start:1382 stop:2239 length:858 start_codon:yes stop_codon:yes gene_type:complete
MKEQWRVVPQLQGSECSETYVNVEDNVSLRVLKWTPINPSAESENTLIMIPGWGSVFEGWRPLLTEWTTKRVILYIETREKKSAIINRKITKKDFKMDVHSNDIATIIDFLKIKHEKIDWFSSSLGATILLNSYQKQIIGGRSSILIGPNINFIPPIWANVFLKFPVPKFTYPILLKIVLFAIEKRVKEEGQKIRYRRMLKAQDPWRMLLSARANVKYNMNLDFIKTTIPCAIFSAESDKLHALEGVMKISESIPNCVLIEVLSNQYTHEPGVLKEIENFHNSIT